MVGASPVTVTHALGSYPVHVEPGVLARLESLAASHLGTGGVALIADATVFDLLQSGQLSRKPWSGEAFTFPSGEASKTREQWAYLTDRLLERGIGRDGGVIALGGGVAGDLVGFVAATYMRGLPCIQAPTSLLAMVDASVGGKTAVDTPHGKNLVGAFHPPVAVAADPRVLRTLPERDYRGGLAEAVKHGLIADAGYFEWIDRAAGALLRRDEEALTHLIRRSVEIKAEVVGEDEREAGRRAILNAGHTVAHALEQASAYAIPHGEAVAIGLVAECALAERLGVAPAGLRGTVASLLERLGLPVRLVNVPAPARILEAMGRDKKNRMARIHFALPSAIGCISTSGGGTTPADERAILGALTAVT